MPNKIIITDDIVRESLVQGKTITEMLASTYNADIQARVQADSRLQEHDAYQMALMDAGVSRNTVVSEIYKTNGGQWLFPTYIDRRLRESVSALNILQYLISSTEVVSGNSVRGAKLTMDEKNKEALAKKRVAEGSDIPLAKLTLVDTAYSLFKRGRAVEASYETYAYQTLNVFSKHLDMIANDVAEQQVGDAIDTLVSGDGNKNAAEAITITGATGLTLEEIVLFAIEFWKKSSLPLNTIIAGDGEFYKALLMMNFNVNEINGMMAGARFNFPQAQLSEINVLYDTRVPKATNKEQLIGLNKEYALTKYLAAGSQIQEYDKNIRNQTHLGTVSEIAGFGKFNDNATLLLKAK